MNLYVGYTHYFDGERFRNQALCCIGETFDEVVFYLQNIRGFLIVNTHNPDNAMLDELMAQANVVNSVVAVGEIIKYQFDSNADMNSFLFNGTRERFRMVEHAGDIDHKLAANMKRKDNKFQIMVPDIIETIITEEEDSFKAELTTAMSTLKKLFVFINRHKDFGPLKKAVMTTIEKMEEIRKGEVNLSDEISSRHPILFCSEAEYRAAVKRQLDWEALREEYRRVIY